jgi:predicted RNA methylase
MIKSIDIPEYIRNILLSSRVEGNTLFIDQQLERATYMDLNKVLEALGGKWNRKARGHVFTGDPRQKIAEALQAGEVIDVKKTFEFFATPLEVANRMVDMVEIPSGSRILEPSAGHGAIADVARALCPDCTIEVVEILDENREVLKEKGYKLVGKDFLKLKKKKPYDIILMNPPFSGQKDMDHVRHAWKFLKPGGSLVSIMAPSVKHRTNKKTESFKEWPSSQPNFFIEDLPPGTFSESGTDVGAVILHLQKPK